MSKLTEEVTLPGVAPWSITAAFAQSDALKADERPMKRRKVAKSGPYSLTHERGDSAPGVPLARLILRLVSINRHRFGNARFNYLPLLKKDILETA